MKKNVTWLAVLAIALIAVLALSGCGGGSSNQTATTGGESEAESSEEAEVQGGGEVVIGFVGAQTGASATMGVGTTQGVELAVDEINAAGGIMGNTIKYVNRDDEADPTKSKTAVEELIDREGIQMLVGSPNSTCVAASEDYVNENKVIHIIPIATNTTLIDAEKYPYSFRTFFPSPVQAEALVGIAKKNGFEKIVLLGDTTALGNDGIASLQEYCDAEGITPAEVVTYNSGDADMTPVAERIKRAEADCVLAWTLGADGAKIVSALSRIGYMDSLYYIGYTGLSLPNFRELAGDGIDRCFTIIGHWSINQGDEKLDDIRQTLYEKIVDRYGAYGPAGRSTAPYMIAAGYDAIYLYKWAVETAGSFDPDAVKEVIETKAADYPGHLTHANIYQFTADNHEGISADDLMPVLLDPMATTDYLYGDVYLRGEFTR
jgi:branched-chain amino acid transport system substrate-binding protein